MANWTQAQLKAIETADRTMLISAAAGSGKTTVLIERIIRSLTDPDFPTDISRMLIVTFTRAAASELRQRISMALSNAIAERPGDERLFRQLTSLGSAHISTIDSFYADVVRRNSQRLDIPPSLRIADDSELIPLKKLVMDRVIDEGYNGSLGFDGKSFAAMTETLCDMRNDDSLADVFTDLYEKLSSHPRFIEFLKESAEFYDTATNCDFFDSPIGSILKEHIASQLEHSEVLMADVCRFFSEGSFADGAHLPPFIADLEFCKNAKKTVLNEGFTASAKMISSYSPMKRKQIKASEKTAESVYYVNIREEVKKKLTKLRSTYFSSGFTDGDMKGFATATAARIRILYALLSRFNELYSEEKLTKSICEFNDIKLWAYRLLVNADGTPTDVAADIAESFDSVYIDEYQDVDFIQDLIFRAISKPHARFMVGDVKQSIYGFRGAEPTLFMNYRNSFPSVDVSDGSDACTVFMSENFRCDNSIIEFANLVCSHVFKTGGKEINYTDGDDLRFSKKVREGYEGNPVKVVIIDKDKPDDGESDCEDETAGADFTDPESEYIAEEISSLTNGHLKADGTPIKLSDVAVLYRSSSFGAKVAKALDKRGIPHNYGSAESIFDFPAVSLALSLLNVIDNPRRDVHLAGVLLSPIFGFDAQMLIDIKKAHADGKGAPLYDSLRTCAESDLGMLSERCSAAVSEINKLRDTSVSLSAEKIIKHIYSKYSLLSSGGGHAQKALKAFYESARSYEGDTFKGLYSYLKYIEGMLSSGKTLQLENSDGANAVNLMTIHKSKGLEFAVCFVGGCGSAFNRDDAKDLLLYSQTLGLAMDLADESGFGRIRTPFRLALSREIYDRSSEEEMRVFYVALTRARERLYVTASPRGKVERELETARMRSTAHTRASILDANNYLSWVLTATYGKSSELFETVILSADEINSSSSRFSDTDAENNESIALPSDELDKAEKYIRDVFSYSYPYLHISNLPAKLSVSKLSPTVLDLTDSTVIETEDDSLDVKLPELARTPSFLSEDDKVSSAQKGIDTHTFMQFCDFERACSLGVKTELDRLINEGFIDKRAADTVNVSHIEKFFTSKLFEEIKTARAIHRERRFNILLPADRFTSDTEYARLISEEKLLVQGVIDLLFETKDGRLILCDYKTDFLSSEELKNKALAADKLTRAHSRQLSYYAAAVKLLFGRYPDETVIYSLPLGDSVVILPEIPQ